ncbi:MAG: PQQ-dependent sugar dehydrogenase [Bacteroidota bacterium]
MLPTTARTGLFAVIFILFSKSIVAQVSCASPGTLIPGCSTGADLQDALNASPTGACGSATASTTYSVWYKFTAGASSQSITLSGLGSGGGASLSTATTYIEAFSGTCGSLTAISTCQNVASALNLTGLTIGNSYYVRIYVTSNPSANPPKRAFTILLSGPASNDNCSNAVTLTPSATCTNVSGNLSNATSSSPGITSTCSGTPGADVWYSFVAPSAFPTITLSNVGSSFSSTYIQILSGSCGSLTSEACANATSITPGGAGLTPGNTYYIRVYSTTVSPSGCNWGFDICITYIPPVVVTASRMNEVYKQTILSDAGVLQYPWEITYGPDNKLWITESRGYKVYRMDPATGAKTTVLDLNSTSTDLSAWGADSLRAVSLTSTSNWNGSANTWPQGGLAGLAIHPQFGDGTHDYVYVSYVHRYLSTASGSAGIFFRNKIVRFTYNSGTGKLGSPAVVCDTIPGGQDHNSQRMIIAPVTSGGTNYLFYACGDMGAGQFANRLRPQNAQNPASYEGKILRFNLESDGDAGADAWIPNSNPYSSSSAVYSIGIRNNQGFAYDTSLNILYGSSHGPYSDDEINIIQSFKNYGHPLVEGFVDGNYNGNSTSGTNTSISAGAPYTDNNGVSTCPPIGDEAANKTAIDASGNGLYKDPFFSAYAVPQATVANIWQTNPGNATPAPGWPTEAWSGLDFYSHTLVPGWKRSLVAASLKWGRLLRLPVGSLGTTTRPNNNVSDTISYFGSQNRFRDLAFSPDGKDIFVIMDNTSTTSGPGSANPVVPQCAGCVQKYTFLGYADAGGKSTIPAEIDVTDGTVNTCNTGTTVTIDVSNSNYWVPITGPDGNIMAEIYANGNNLGTVTSSFYKNSGAIRIKSGNHYLDRNITITPQTQPLTPVKIRLYISKAEFDALDADPVSGVTNISSLKILKNSDACGNAITATTTTITPTYAEAHGANGYMLQGDISGFSSFYFSSTSTTLPLDLLTFSGSLQNNNTVFLKWKTENEINTSHFVIERSIDGSQFKNIGTVSTNGNNYGGVFDYSFTDVDAANQQSLLLYYRLKIVDINGSFKYSNVINISLPNSPEKLTVSPNPVFNETRITLSSPVNGTIRWKLFDNAGRVIQQNSEHVRQGNGNSFTINMNKLSRGSYYLSVSGAGIDQNVKLQKL